MRFSIEHLIKRLLGVFLTMTLVLCLKANAGVEFTMLKSMLGSREAEPKMYLPQSVIIGSDLEVLVQAPGAESIKLLCSKSSGETTIDGKSLRISSDFQELGEVKGSRGEFKLNVDSEKYQDMVDKPIFFEALVCYPDGRKRTALFYGSNAYYTNVNAVRITAVPKDSSGAAAMAKAMMPGFFNQGQQRF